jgi:hypothetical protein
MEQILFAKETLDLLCSYVGDDKVFETLIDRWGIEEMFDIVSRLYAARQEISPTEETEDDELD